MGDVDQSSSNTNISIGSIHFEGEYLQYYDKNTLEKAISSSINRPVEIGNEQDISALVELLVIESDSIWEYEDQFDDPIDVQEFSEKKERLKTNLKFLQLGQILTINEASNLEATGTTEFQRRHHQIRNEITGNYASGGSYRFVGFDLISKSIFVKITNYFYDYTNSTKKYPGGTLTSGNDRGMYVLTFKEFLSIYKSHGTSTCYPGLDNIPKYADWNKRFIIQ